MAEYSLGLINNTPNNHNPEEVGRCHSNAEDHHSGSTHNMVGEYHIMASQKGSNECLASVGRPSTTSQRLCPVYIVT